MKKLIRLISYSLALFFILATALVSFLVTTNAGLYTSLHLVNWMTPGNLSVKKATGTLLSNWHLEKVIFENDKLHTTLDTLEVHWHLFELLKGHVAISQLTAGHLQIHNKLGETSASQSASKNRSQNNPLQLPINLTINDLSIDKVTVDQYSLSNIHLKMQADQSNWQISQLSLKTFHSQFKLSGQFIPIPPFSTEITLAAKALNSNGISGEVTIKGDWFDYAWQGFFTSPFSLATAGHFNEGNAINGQVKWREFTLPGQHTPPIRMAPGELTITGNADKLAFNLRTALMKPTQTQIKISGYHRPQHNQALIIVSPNQGRLTAKIQQDIEQSHTKTMIELEGKHLDLTPFQIPITQLNIQGKAFGSSLSDLIGKLSVKGFYYRNPISISLHKTTQHLSSEIRLANNRISIDGKFPFPLTIKGSLPSPQLLSPLLEGLNTQINLRGTLNNDADGHIQLSVQAGQYTHPKEPSIPPLSFIGGGYNFILSKRGLHISGKLAIDKQKTLLTKIQLPNWSLHTGSQKSQTISGQFNLNLNSLDFISQLTPYITEANGKISAQLLIHGQLANPQLNGKIELKQGHIKTSTSDKPFQPITAKIMTSNHQWQLQSAINYQGNQLTVTGSGQFTPQIKGNITVTGNSFLAMDSKEYQVYVSPNISISLLPGQTQITGELTIPKALIKPQTFSSTITLSDDVVFANQQQDETESSLFSLNLQIKMGDNVRLLIEGLSAKIIGAVRLQKQSGGTLTSSGQLSVADGQYAAYGQKLDISQGELLFAGGSISNPGINIRATRTFNNTGQAFSGSNRLFDFGASNIQPRSFSNVTTVGVQLSGRLNNPKISLFSEPSNLQQSDILSMLILGRPASQASSAGGQLLLSAITNMGLDKGTEGGQLLSQLQNNLGLEVGVDSDTTYDRQQNEVSTSHSLGIKKKFSDRLSIGYNMGIYDSDSMVLTLTYLLNKFLSIQVNASDNASGIDLTYTRSKD